MEGQVPERRPRSDASQLRISDDDRHQVAEVLRQAAGEGRLDIEELDERLEATYRAKTYADLVPITVDLPAGARHDSVAASRPRPAAPQPGAPRYTTSVAVMSETKRTGPWVVEDGHSAFAFMGSVVLDLRAAQFEEGDLTVNASSIMGEVKLIVDAGTTVVVDGVGLMGDYSEQRPRVPFDAALGGPVVRVRGLALMGSVHVQRKGAPGEGLRKRLGLAGH